MNWIARIRAYGPLVAENANLSRENRAARRSAASSQKKADRLAKRIAVLDAALLRRKGQIRHDQAYIDLLEEFVPHSDLANIRAQLRDEAR